MGPPLGSVPSTRSAQAAAHDRRGVSPAPVMISPKACPDKPRSVCGPEEHQGAERVASLKIAQRNRPAKVPATKRFTTAATAANTAAKLADNYRHAATSLEYRPRPQSPVGSSGRLAHAYGSEGRGFECLRVRRELPGQQTGAAPSVSADLGWPVCRTGATGIWHRHDHRRSNRPPRTGG
jgi:hypothetical protein